MREHRAILVTGLSFLFSVEAVAQVPADRQPDPPAPNILVIVADDIGVDILSVYDEGYEKACNSYFLEDHDQCYSSDDCPLGQTCVPNYPPTPTIDSLAASGILFRNAWSCPTCSPTRATIQTGRYGFRTGVLFAGGPGGHGGGDPDLPGYEITIPEALALAGSAYPDVAIGKWHLGGGVTGPNDQGYPDFYGTEENFWPGISSYYVWPRIVNGVEATCYNYATSQNVDDAIAWIGQQSGPWFMYLAFNAAHIPVHAPPDDLHSYHGVDRPELPWAWVIDVPPLHSHNCILAAGTRDYRYCYLADVEAMDCEMGRLLAALGPDWPSSTTIIFVGDNGTPGKATPGCDVIAPPFNPWHGKGTMYEGGVNVPLIISGARVQDPNRESVALVNTTDLFATILNLAGIDPEDVITDRPIDSVSLMPIIEDSTPGSLRDYVYSDQYLEVLGIPRGYEQTIRNVEGYKLIHRPYKLVNRYELYYLPDDWWEDYDLYNDLWPNLTPVQQYYFDDLKAQMESLVTSVSPPDGESCQPTSGALEWPVDPEAEGYRIQIGTECGTGPEFDVTDAHYDYDGLQTDTTYWWRVRSKYALGIYGPYSRCYSFITAPDALSPPTLLIPADGATGQRPLGTLDWSDVSGAVGYRVQVGTACGTGPEYDVIGSQYGYSGLASGATYHWRVKTKDICNQFGDYSTCFSFDVAPEPDINCEDLEGHYFGSVAQNTCSAEQTWQITNTGDALLEGQGEGVHLCCGDVTQFEITQGAGQSCFPLEPGHSCTVAARFCPTSEGPKACTLRISSNDPDENPCNLELTGKGIDFGDCSDGDVTIDPGDPLICDPELSDPDVCVLMDDMNFRNLTVPGDVTLDTHGYTVKVCENLVNNGVITDNWSGGDGGPGGDGGKGDNPWATSVPPGCGPRDDSGGCETDGVGGDGVPGDEPSVEGAGWGGQGGGGGGGGGGSWHWLTQSDADGGNGGEGGEGGKGGGYVKVYAYRFDNQGVIHADGQDGEDGEDAPRGDEGVMHDPDDPFGYWKCGAEYYKFRYPLLQWRDLAGGGGGGGGGGAGGEGGTVDYAWYEMIHEGEIHADGGEGGQGGNGGSGGGDCVYEPIFAGVNYPCPPPDDYCGCDGGQPNGGKGGGGGVNGDGGDAGIEGATPGALGSLGSGGQEGVVDPHDLAKCSTDADCDDGLYCNGVEQCDGNGDCIPGTPPDCDDGLDCTTDWCDDAWAECRHDVEPGHCLIDGVCYAAGTVNSANECEECNPLMSTLDWSPRPAGVQCGDWDWGPCDEPDTCDGTGICQPNHLSDGTPCDDGVWCNGSEACVSGDCQPGEPPIPAPGDIYGDGNVDLEDFAALIEALSGPGLMPTVPVPACLEWYLVAFDLDADVDVDLADFAVFQQVFTGAP